MAGRTLKLPWSGVQAHFTYIMGISLLLCCAVGGVFCISLYPSHSTESTKRSASSSFYNSENKRHLPTRGRTQNQLLQDTLLRFKGTLRKDMRYIVSDLHGQSVPHNKQEHANTRKERSLDAPTGSTLSNLEPFLRSSKRHPDLRDAEEEHSNDAKSTEVRKLLYPLINGPLYRRRRVKRSADRGRNTGLGVYTWSQLMRQFQPNPSTTVSSVTNRPMVDVGQQRRKSTLSTRNAISTIPKNSRGSGGYQQSSGHHVLYIKKSGKFLRISPDGTVSSVDLKDCDVACVVTFNTIRVQSDVIEKIKGESTGLYLAMNADGSLYTTTRYSDLNTNFAHIYRPHSHDAYRSRHKHYLAFRGNGKPYRRSRITSSNNLKARFLVLEADETLIQELEFGKTDIIMSQPRSTATPDESDKSRDSLPGKSKRTKCRKVSLRRERLQNEQTALAPNQKEERLSVQTKNCKRNKHKREKKKNKKVKKCNQKRRRNRRKCRERRKEKRRMSRGRKDRTRRSIEHKLIKGLNWQVQSKGQREESKDVT